MWQLGIASIFFATIPVFALSAAPRANEEILGVFGPEVSRSELIVKSQRFGLDVVRIDVERGHLIVRDRYGNAIRALDNMGARMVINSSLFSNCSASNSTVKQENQSRTL